MTDLMNMIINGMTRALYVEAYVSAIEEHEIDGPSAGSGEDWMDVAPPTPDYDRERAILLAGRIEERNKMSLVSLFYSAAKADGIDPYAELQDEDDPYWYERRENRHCNYAEKYAEEFGHYLAMQSLGHGVSWFDDHARFPLSLPYIDSIELKD